MADDSTESMKGVEGKASSHGGVELFSTHEKENSLGCQSAAFAYFPRPGTAQLHGGEILKLYPLFFMMATITVLTPGPGVVMTLTNTLRYGLRQTVGGIFGIAAGTLVVAGLTATGLGILLSASAVAFTAMKLLGATYLIYLGVRLWRSPGFHFTARDRRKGGFARVFVEGISLQLTNPKAIVFFLSVLPQFIDAQASYASQFAVLVLTYSILVVVIHCLYGLCARRARAWLTSEYGAKVLIRTGAAAFMLFGIGLAGAAR